MIQACHYTAEQFYQNIKKDGFLKSPETRLNSGEEVEHNFLIDQILGDREYTFFSVLKSDMDIGEICTGGYGDFGFIFDAEQLIREFNGLASIDLHGSEKYGYLHESIAKEVYMKLNPDATEDDEGFYDILFSMLERYEGNEADTEAIRLLDQRAPILRSENRVAGDDALALIQQGSETDLEILVTANVPVELAIAEIVDGKYVPCS